MRLSVGIDIVAVGDVAESIRVHAERYLNRVYSRSELEDCARPGGGHDPARLAARFAAKEATMKALRVADEAVPWNAISVVRDAHGRPSLRLHGPAAALAGERGVGGLEVSLTHEGPFAAAVVLAQSGGAS